MESVPCIICGSNSHKPFASITDRLNNQSSEVFQLVKCQCEFIYLSPRPSIDQIQSYYDNSNYQPHSRTNSLFNFGYKLVQRFTLKWKYNKILPLKRSGTLLDIGGGQGEFCNYMQNKKWNTTLLEPNYSDVKINNFKTITSLDELKNNDKFDIITLWHSLEHIHNVDALLLKLHSYLSDDGYLIIAVPNVNAIDRKYYGHNWAPFDAPRHLYHFSPKTLTELLENYKFQLISQYSMLQDTPYNVILSEKKKTIFTLFRLGYFAVTFLFKIMKRGVDISSSFMVICKKQ